MQLTIFVCVYMAGILITCAYRFKKKFALFKPKKAVMVGRIMGLVEN